MNKVCLMTCSGLTSGVGTILRQSVYRVVEDLRPEKTVLGCLPATNANVQEDIDFITQFPTVAVEGCSDTCVTRVMAKKGQHPAIVINGEELLRRWGLDLADEGPDKITPLAEKAVHSLARTLAHMVDLILEGASDVLS